MCFMLFMLFMKKLNEYNTVEYTVMNHENQ